MVKFNYLLRNPLFTPGACALGRQEQITSTPLKHGIGGVDYVATELSSELALIFSSSKYTLSIFEYIYRAQNLLFFSAGAKFADYCNK